MRKYFNKKVISILTLGLVCIMGMPMTSFASSGSAYDYANLGLTWTTSATGASAVLKSDKQAMLIVEIGGESYDGGSTEDFYKSSGQVHDNKATVSKSRPYVNIRNGYASGSRNFTQTIETVIYYR